MDEFTPITTQEQLDAFIGERYGDYDEIRSRADAAERQVSELTSAAEAAAKTTAGHEKTIAELTEKLKSSETAALKAKIAHETGIPYELAGRLTGETEADLRKDAETLARFVNKPRQSDPLFTTEPSGLDNKSAALRALAGQLTV